MEEQTKLGGTLKATEISQEQLNKELQSEAKKVSTEILQRQKEEKTKQLLTNPSELALSTTKHDAGQGISAVKKTVRQLFILYLTNQYVARAINVRADTLVSPGFNILGEDEKGVKACKQLIEDSGGVNLFWQLSTNTDIAGDGFLEKVYNVHKSKILRLKHVHPLTLTFKKDEQTDRIILNSDKEPESYVQIFINKEGKEETEDIAIDIIEHLKFNTLGDEFTGISTIQSGYNTIVRLMNMEYSAAEAAIKTANPLIVIKANTKSPHQIAMWGQILGRISGREQVFIPEGMELEFKSPGNQNFSEYSEYFLNAIVACFGVPKSVLLGSSSSDQGSGNRAEGVILSRHFYSLIRSNQRYMSDFFNKIFIEYGELANFKPPTLEFEDIAEDASLLTDSAIKLLDASIIDVQEARNMIGLDKAKDIKKLGNSVTEDVKKDARETQFPATPGSPKGSQKGIKTKQKRDGFSSVRPDTK